MIFPSFFPSREEEIHLAADKVLANVIETDTKF